MTNNMVVNWFSERASYYFHFVEVVQDERGSSSWVYTTAYAIHLCFNRDKEVYILNLLLIVNKIQPRVWILKNYISHAAKLIWTILLSNITNSPPIDHSYWNYKHCKKTPHYYKLSQLTHQTSLRRHLHFSLPECLVQYLWMKKIVPCCANLPLQ